MSVREKFKQRREKYLATWPDFLERIYDENRGGKRDADALTASRIAQETGYSVPLVKKDIAAIKRRRNDDAMKGHAAVKVAMLQLEMAKQALRSTIGEKPTKYIVNREVFGLEPDKPNPMASYNYPKAMADALESLLALTEYHAPALFKLDSDRHESEPSVSQIRELCKFYIKKLEEKLSEIQRS